MAQSPAELFGTSWTLHRLSPLFHAQESKLSILDNPDALSLYARRLRDMLTGDQLRGIRLSLDSTSLLDEALEKAGALVACKWETIPTWSYWNEEHSILEDPEQTSLVVSAEQSAGILVTLQYEAIRYKAALLSGPDGYRQQQHEVTYLPLLVTRMPNALRQAFISFLENNFDARVSILRLPSAFLCSCLEAYLTTLSHKSQREDGTRAALERVIKEVQLTLSFPPPTTPLLKNLEISLPRQSLSDFYIRALDNKAKPHDGGSSLTTPFLSALLNYFKTHLAMDIDITAAQPPKNHANHAPRITKIACGAFVLGSEGRMKLLANPGRAIFLDDSQLSIDSEDDSIIGQEEQEKRCIWRANEGLLRALIGRATCTQHRIEERATLNNVTT
ncbi:hypothetical protein LOZ12_005694 [Ophidiomyces ophidiicola]|uniref:Uncharacterized protein n=1 Tax=Ophidiomyces ophidiicola TaxID=1387563 RepID=A0ACB8UY80_9EURO|nr:uncharacterized protein LOZ57_002128 [Ophidiomyces ophidiicola]KAI1937878.1 hypothetical protein LOZ62_005371 [Ophidiomyces ophidiicola]KAI1950565.1 hypothetical protein LOZ57_002128 [Ophidiomyces ophidiicola]KAI1952450.1 hypothetical protein LOZ59_005396 [Ophidiomyces ophidiicola]KAI1968321.1 hypothetical protein LOZ56_005085 [Ophidiomyces ophidiicola]KAI2022106.1 hypothetical protein LOZ45_004514 [Ophidiomyces ophidiicola]